MDATAMVRLAKKWTNVPKQVLRNFGSKVPASGML
jgi:hypothetical protein